MTGRGGHGKDALSNRLLVIGIIMLTGQYNEGLALAGMSRGQNVAIVSVGEKSVAED
jgi:hypothetical protein